jgi:dextranase
MISLVTLYAIPDKALYLPGEPVCLRLRLEDGRPLAGWRYECTVLDLNTTVYREHGHWGSDTAVRIPPIQEGSGAYGVFIAVSGPNGEQARAETAFDVAEHWREAPRYGFLSDFEPEEAGLLEDVEFLNRQHITIVQFYDWLYRHDRLLPESEEFIDPLGRRMSLKVVREKIAALRGHGITSMAYVAVYASLPDYIEKHPEQGLYQNDGKTYSLGDYFHIMDISEDSEWTQHMLREYRQVMKTMDFGGIHLDQYGFPKKAIRKKDAVSEVVSLKELYPKFINLVRQEMSAIHDDLGVIFNNVSNYPTHTTAGADQDVMYIEVWDPASSFRDLKQTIDNARKWSGKQVVLAAYLPCFHPEKLINPKQTEIGGTLAMAAIFASGGYHLLLGEREKLLADPYFPKYGSLSAGFRSTMQHYYDFIVMYRNLLYDLALDDVSMALTGGINTEIVFSHGDTAFAPNGARGTVWTFVKEKPGYLVMHLINLCGLDNDIWHEAKGQEPPAMESIEIKAEVVEEIEGICWASPDGDSIQPEELSYEWVPKGGNSGNYVRFQVPRLNYWSMVWIKTRS